VAGTGRKKPDAAFDAAKWIPLDQAYVRMNAALGAVAAYDLLGGLRSWLPSAVRHVWRNGAETFEPLEPSFWGKRNLKVEEFYPSAGLATGKGDGGRFPLSVCGAKTQANSWSSSPGIS
jgi:hypothetical protein